ncbi:MAG: hypothetical protein QGH33_00385 [Pirellulaceae bacterium]|nr:hypothetical protein [Pirellulaceae bacterium]
MAPVASALDSIHPPPDGTGEKSTLSVDEGLGAHALWRRSSGGNDHQQRDGILPVYEFQNPVIDSPPYLHYLEELPKHCTLG